MGKLRARNRPKRPDSKAIARRRQTVVVRTGGGTGKANKVMVARLDRRSRVGKAYMREVKELIAHLGGIDVLTAPQRALVEQAARLSLLEHIAWAELSRAASLTSKKGAVHPAFEPFLRASRDRRAVLQLLGLGRPMKEIPDLQSYVEAECGDSQVW